MLTVLKTSFRFSVFGNTPLVRHNLQLQMKVLTQLFQMKVLKSNTESNPRSVQFTVYCLIYIINIVHAVFILGR